MGNFNIYTHMPQLKDCRGQVVLIYSWEAMKDVIGAMVYETEPAKSVERVPGGNTEVTAEQKVENLYNFFYPKLENVLIPNDVTRHLDFLYVADTNTKTSKTMNFLKAYWIPENLATIIHDAVAHDGALLDRYGGTYPQYYG